MPHTAHCGIEPSSRGMLPDVRQQASGLAKAMFWRGGPTEAQFSGTRAVQPVENFEEPLRNARCSPGWESNSSRTYLRRPNLLSVSGGNARRRQASASERRHPQRSHETSGVSALRLVATECCTAVVGARPKAGSCSARSCRKQCPFPAGALLINHIAPPPPSPPPLTTRNHRRNCRQGPSRRRRVGRWAKI